MTLSLSTLRRHAASQGYRLWKVPDGITLDLDYGPYSLTIAASNEIAVRGVSLEALADFLESKASAAGDEASRRRHQVVPRRQLRQPLPRPWTLDRLIRRQWSITNRSGSTARSVTFTASGTLMISGSRDWTTTVAHLENGQGYAITGSAGWGSTVDKPEIRVTWFNKDPAEMKGVTLRWPASAISFPGVPRQARLD